MFEYMNSCSEISKMEKSKGFVAMCSLFQTPGAEYNTTRP